MTNRWSRRDVMRAAAAATAVGVLPADAAFAKRRPRASAADLVIHGGKVLTLDRRSTVAQAVAIKDGRVMAVGRAKEIRGLVGRRTETIDAKGATVLPGLNDSHLHYNSFGLTLPPFQIDVDVPTIDQLVAEVKAGVDGALRADAWVRGRGWNDNRLPRLPTRHDLDAVSGEHPVVLTDFSGHALLVNTKLLRMSGITRDTVPPPGGVIEKDADGEPTGVLREGAMRLALAPPAFTDAESAASLKTGMEIILAQGITSITDPGTSMEMVRRYAAMARAGTLHLRVTNLLRAGASAGELRAVLREYRPLSRAVDPRMVRVAGIKIFADGIPTQAKTAWMRKPYSDGTNGTLTLDGKTLADKLATLRELIRLSHAAGFQIGTHATGDATIDAVVSNYVRVLRRGRRNKDPRHYLIHADYVHQETLRTMARYDIGANFNATIKYLLGRTTEPVLGARIENEWPYRSALRAGVNVASSSDAPVTFPSVLQGLMGAATGAGRFGGVRGRHERISVEQALRTYTTGGAWQDHAERWKGRLTPGMAADVAILDGDLLKTDPRDLEELQFRTTILGGKVVYERKSTIRAAAASTRFAAAKRPSSAAREAHAISCLQGGKCCCTLSEEVLAGQLA